MIRSVYVAAPWGRWRAAREAGEILALGPAPIYSTSRWILAAENCPINVPPEPDAARLAAEIDDADVQRADAMLVLSYPTEGGEMFAEARFALSLRKPVVWVKGREILSAFRTGVALVKDLAEAVRVLRGLT